MPPTALRVCRPESVHIGVKESRLAALSEIATGGWLGSSSMPHSRHPYAPT